MSPAVDAVPCLACGYPLEGEACKLCEGSVKELTSMERIEPGPGFFLFDLIQGLLSPFLAMLVLMTRKEFMGKLMWAVVANIVAFVVILIIAWWGVYEFFEWLIPDTDSWEKWLGWLAGIMAFSLTLVSVFFLAPVIIETVTGPFLDPIAEATEEIMAEADMKPLDMGFWKNTMFGLTNAAKIMALQVVILVPCLILCLIPLVNLIAIPLAFLVAAYLNALVWFEIPVMRRGYSMAYRRKLVRTNWARALGFGLGFELGLFVPFFNIFFLTPATAVAVSQLYFRFEKGGRSEKGVGARSPGFENQPVGG